MCIITSLPFPFLTARKWNFNLSNLVFLSKISVNSYSSREKNPRQSLSGQAVDWLGMVESHPPEAFKYSSIGLWTVKLNSVKGKIKHVERWIKKE